MPVKLKITLTKITWILLISASCSTIFAKEKPNIVIIYMDDLGYGDVSAYGATEINTPNMDKLAEGGIRFTTGYASSSTCSPSRYASAYRGISMEK